MCKYAIINTELSQKDFIPSIGFTGMVLANPWREENVTHYFVPREGDGSGGDGVC